LGATIHLYFVNPNIVLYLQQQFICSSGQNLCQISAYTPTAYFYNITLSVEKKYVLPHCTPLQNKIFGHYSKFQLPNRVKDMRLEGMR